MDKNVILNRIKDGATKVADTAKKTYDVTVPKAKEFVNDAAVKAKETASDAAVKAKELANDAAIKAKEVEQDVERAIFKPVTLEKFNDVLFEIPKLIQIITDNTYRNKETFADAIGFIDKYGTTEVLNLYADCIENTNFVFYPVVEEGIYYRDVYKQNNYISLNEYFDYTKKARVQELVYVAQSLGAKSCKIGLKEERKQIVAKHFKGNYKVNDDAVSADISSERLSDEFSALEIVDESTFVGSAVPVRPELVYFNADDVVVKSIIEQRMDLDNPVHKRLYKTKYSNSSVMKMSDAVQIDSILKKMKLNSNTSLTSECERENRLTLEIELQY